jgi:hypothetical protein
VTGVPTPEADAVREELARLYRAAQESIDRRLAELAADPAAAARRGALRRQLLELSQDVTRIAGDLDSAAREWTSRRLPEVYAMGGADTAPDTFGWAQSDVEAVRQLAVDTYGDLLRSTRFMRRDVKAFIREATRGQARVALLEGTTATRAGEQLARQLRDRGVNAVRYKNGALHSIGDYSDMVLRSKTAEAYNRGAISSLRSAGVTFVEVSDGPDCGWTSHDDADKANGTIRSVDEAERYFIAHPRCARSFGGRPDITTPGQATQQRALRPAEQRRQAQAEQTRARTQRAATQARARRIQKRRARLTAAR